MLDYMKALLAPFVNKFIKDEDGQGMVEYSLIVALISIAAITVMTLIGPQISAIFQKITDALK